MLAFGEWSLLARWILWALECDRQSHCQDKTAPTVNSWVDAKATPWWVTGTASKSKTESRMFSQKVWFTVHGLPTIFIVAAWNGPSFLPFEAVALLPVIQANEYKWTPIVAGLCRGEVQLEMPFPLNGNVILMGLVGGAGVPGRRGSNPDTALVDLLPPSGLSSFLTCGLFH